MEKFHDRPELKWVERVSRLLDSKFVIPGTKIRFGLDPILSLFPVAGDVITYVVSIMLIYTMYKNGASGKLVVKMMINSSLDALIGAIPLIGTIFDVFYKANERNIRLLREHYSEGKHQGSGMGLLLGILVIVAVTIAAILVGIWVLVDSLVNVLTQLG